MALFVQTSGTHSTNSASFVPIPGLRIALPQGVNTLALIILNLPLPFAQGSNFPGGNVGISIDGAVSPVVGGFTYSEQVPPLNGRVPTTLVVGVPLTIRWQIIEAVWSGVRGSTVTIDSPATLSAILG